MNDLRSAIADVKRGGRHRDVRCPGPAHQHGDRRPSLSVSRGADGRILLRCHAGCETEAVLAAAGLSFSDLYESNNGRPASERRTWEIRHASGEIIAVHVRYRGDDGNKRYSWERPGGERGLGGIRTADLPLYRLPELASAQAESEGRPLVVLCEGERAADAAARLGLVAVGTVTGAATIPSDETLRPLVDTRLLVWPDADGEGREHMRRIAARVQALGGTLEGFIIVPDAKPGDDAADFRGSRDDALQLVKERLPDDATPAATASAATEERRFEAVDEDRYRLVVSDIGVTFELDHVRRERHQLVGELAVRCELPGARTFDGVLSTGDLNLSSTRARVERARYLASRAQTGGELDWTGLLEEFSQRVLAAERAGQPDLLLRDLARPTPDEAFEIDGLQLLRRHPVIWFGDGGAAKSYLGLYIAGRLAQRRLRVELFDWELAGEDHRDRLERLFGREMPPIRYARCTRPLVHELDRLRRIARDHQLDYVIFDSVAFACDGPPEAAEVAARYFQALRQLGVIGSLHVAHINKSDGSDRKPFGSAFWHNGARATWFVKLAESVPDANQITIGVYNRKANLGAIRPAVGFEIRFDENETTFRRVDVADVPDLAAGLSLLQRIRSYLREGAQPREVIMADFDDEKRETLRRTINRAIERGQLVRLPGPDERIGLPVRGVR